MKIGSLFGNGFAESRKSASSDEDEILELYELTIAEAKAEVARARFVMPKHFLLYNAGIVFTAETV